MKKNNNYFDKYAVAIIPPDGNTINVEKIPEEKYHYQTFKRINRKILPFKEGWYTKNNISGYDFAQDIAIKGYVVLLPIGPTKMGTFILMMPNEITEKQYNEIEKLLPNINDSNLYAITCWLTSKKKIIKKVNFVQDNYDKTILRVLDIGVLDYKIIK